MKDIAIEGSTYENYYQASAVMAGTVRLADKSHTLEDGQFLSFQPANSIQTLLRLRLSQETAPA